MGVHLKLAVDACCTPVRLRGSARSSRQPSSIGTVRLCCGWFDVVPIATRLWHFYGRLEWDSWIRWPSRCVRPLQRSRVENHRTRSQLRSGELCRRTIPSTTSCRPCTRYLASQHGASLLGTLCDVVRNPQERGTLRSEYRAFLSSQVEAEVPGVSTVRLFLVSAKCRTATSTLQTFLPWS